MYSAMSAGRTANAHEVWQGGTFHSHLLSVHDPVHDVSGFASNRTYSAANTLRWVRETFQVDLSDVADKNRWFIPNHDANGLYARTVNLGGKREVLGLRIRDTLFTSARVGSGNTLRSHAFTVTYNPASDSFTFFCRGFGHGVGLSQEGANVFARQGRSYDWILRHYYTGAAVS
jgi:stage II sporulation protein D